MSLPKITFTFLYTCLAALACYIFFVWPDNSLFLITLVGFGLISYKRPIWGLYILLILPVFGEFSRLEFLGKSIVLSDILIPLFEFAALLTVKKSHFDHKTSKLIKTLLVFLFIALISLSFSLLALPGNEVLQSSLYLIRLAFYLTLFPITYLLLKPANYQQFLLWVVFSSTMVCLTGFLQLQFLPSLEQLAKAEGYDPHINRLVGSWLDPNFIGGFFAFISVIFISLGLYQKPRKLKILYFSSSTVLLIGLFLTYSRSAYLAFIISILLLGLVKARRLLIFIIIIGSIGLASSDRAQQRVGELVTSMTSVLFNTAENPDPTARLRIENWEQTLELIGQKPLLGHGYNTLTYVKLSEGFIKDESTHSASGSDSSLLTILATTGLLGLFIYLISIFLIFRDTIFSWIKSHSELEKGLSLGLISGFAGLLIHSNFVNSLFFPQIMIFFWPLLGLFYKVSQTEQPEKV